MIVTNLSDQNYGNDVTSSMFEACWSSIWTLKFFQILIENVDPHFYLWKDNFASTSLKFTFIKLGKALLTMGKGDRIVGKYVV